MNYKTTYNAAFFSSPNFSFSYLRNSIAGCEENNSHKFFYRGNVRKCKWLKNRSAAKRGKIWKRDEGNEEYCPAKAECRIACETCIDTDY